MRLDFLFLGKTKESYLDAGIKDYLKRLQRYTPATITQLKEKKLQRDEKRLREEEGRSLLDKVDKNAFIVALDPGGKSIDSTELAFLVEKWQREAFRTIAFLIGGPTGLSKEVLKKAHFVLSLSKMTYTHEMARFILVEQLYRAYSINAGSKYHK